MRTFSEDLRAAGRRLATASAAILISSPRLKDSPAVQHQAISQAGALAALDDTAQCRKTNVHSTRDSGAADFRQTSRGVVKELDISFVEREGRTLRAERLQTKRRNSSRPDVRARGIVRFATTQTRVSGVMAASIASRSWP